MPAESQNRKTTIDATVTSNGRVTLPHELLKRLRLEGGSKVLFKIFPNGTVEMLPLERAASEARGASSKIT
jgi:bifunctional DNA-binding transcriptional regulator/antitoxin component of YhaV-PrlF toxin-antitoxin module